MTAECLTHVDVEDWYDGMAGARPADPPPHGARSGLVGLAGVLDGSGGGPGDPVRGGQLRRHRPVTELNGAGGPRSRDRQPRTRTTGGCPRTPHALVQWLRGDGQMVEDAGPTAGPGIPVAPVRRPGLDGPGRLPGAAGARPASTMCPTPAGSGAGRRCAELPVLTRHGFPLGGGSYQRLLPSAAISVGRRSRPRAGRALLPFLRFRSHPPGARSIRSLAAAKQLVGRGRVAGMFSRFSADTEARRVLMSER